MSDHGVKMQVYGLSKLMNIMWAKALNEKLKGTGVEAFCAHPGKTLSGTENMLKVHSLSSPYLRPAA